MSPKNNYGWFTWKPYFILQAMEQLKEGDKVLLLDTLMYTEIDNQSKDSMHQ